MEPALHNRGRSHACQRPNAGLADTRVRHFQECIQQFRQPIGFGLDLRQKCGACAFVPIDICSTQTAYKSLDVAEWQAELVCRCRQQLVRPKVM